MDRQALPTCYGHFLAGHQPRPTSSSEGDVISRQPVSCRQLDDACTPLIVCESCQLWPYLIAACPSNRRSARPFSSPSPSKRQSVSNANYLHSRTELIRTRAPALTDHRSAISISRSKCTRAPELTLLAMLGIHSLMMTS